jgi:hypothetical protein
LANDDSDVHWSFTPYFSFVYTLKGTKDGILLVLSFLYACL